MKIINAFDRWEDPIDRWEDPIGFIVRKNDLHFVTKHDNNSIKYSFTQHKSGFAILSNKSDYEISLVVHGNINDYDLDRISKLRQQIREECLFYSMKRELLKAPRPPNGIQVEFVDLTNQAYSNSSRDSEKNKLLTRLNFYESTNNNNWMTLKSVLYEDGSFTKIVSSSDTMRDYFHIMQNMLYNNS